MKIKNLIILTVCAAFLFPSVSIAQSKYEYIKNGLNSLYNFEFSNAEKYFNIAVNSSPDNPYNYLLLSSISLWKFVIDKKQVDYDKFNQLSDSAITKATEALEEADTNYFLYYTLGLSYRYKAIAFVRNKNYLDAIWASKKSEAFLSAAINLKPDFYDAYLGLGLYYFIADQLPVTFKWALNLAGIKGDKELGLKYIKLTADSGNFSKVEAQYYLSQFLVQFFFDYDNALVYLKKLVKRFPSNEIFRYSLASLYYKKGNLIKAKSLLKQLSYQIHPVFKQISALSYFLNAEILFKMNNFERAMVDYYKFNSLTKEKALKGLANYKIGLCFELRGDTLNSKSFFELSNEGDMDFEDDIFAKRKGLYYVNHRLSKEEMKTIVFKNYLDRNQNKLAKDSLLNLLQKPITDTLKSEAMLYLIEAEFKLNNYNRVVELTDSLLKLDCGDELWVKPFALYYSAYSSFNLDDFLSANNKIEMIEEFKGYDYQRRLKGKLFVLKLKLKQKNDGNVE